MSVVWDTFQKLYSIPYEFDLSDWYEIKAEAESSKTKHLKFQQLKAFHSCVILCYSYGKLLGNLGHCFAASTKILRHVTAQPQSTSESHDNITTAWKLLRDSCHLQIFRIQMPVREWVLCASDYEKFDKIQIVIQLCEAICIFHYTTFMT